MEAHKLSAGSQLNVNPANALEDAQALEARKRQRDIWLEENRDGIEAYNELVAQQGVFSTGLRGFDAPVHGLPEQEFPDSFDDTLPARRPK